MADNKDKKVLNVPALRFPEFTGEWEKCKLSKVCSFFSGGTPPSSNKEYYNGNIPFIRSGELHNDETELFITKEGLDNSAAKMVEVGDLLLALYGATSGEIAISKIKGAINQAILCIRTKQNKKFVESVWNKHVARLLQTYLQGGQGNLSADIVKNIPFYFTNIEEQNKLARFISLLDQRIAAQNKIIEKLETLIKGIVVTHHRKYPYKQFVEISKLGKSFSVGVLSKEDLAEDGTPCILYGELFTTYNCVADVIESRTNRTDNQVYSKGDELLFPASTTVDAVSLITPTALIVANVVLGGDMFGIHINKEYNAIYISYILNYVYRQRIAKYAQGCTIIHLHYKDIKNFKLSLPPIEKQEKIVNTLNSMQEKIDCEKQNLRLLNDLRSFLLSKLFI